MSTGRDLLGEVLRAVGPRALPDREDYDAVFDVAFTAWRRSVSARRRRRCAFAIAAGIAAAAVGVSAFMQRMPEARVSSLATAVVLHGEVMTRSPREAAWHPLTLGDSMTSGSRVRTGMMAGVALELEGGVSLRLHERSELEMDSVRTWRLTSGRLFVDTRSVAAGALRVETALGVVSDVGTVFQVDAQSGALRVRVREGAVQLNAVRGDARYESAAGEELELDAGGRVTRGRIEPSHAAWAWAEALAPAPEVEGRPLLQFLQWVAHETGRSVSFETPAVEAQAREVILHGKVRDLRPLQALDVMLSTTDLEYVLSTDHVILIRRRTE